MEHQGEIILYQPEEAVKLEVRLDSETVWLNRQQLSILFDRDIKTIGKHINNALKEELALRLIMEDNTTITQNPTVANFATVQKEGNFIYHKGAQRYVTKARKEQKAMRALEDFYLARSLM